MRDAAWWEAEAGRLADSERRAQERMWAETQRAHRAETLLDVAVGILRHNRDRLGKPRGDDERRLLNALDTMTTGPAANGTSGWVDWDQLELFGEHSPNNLG